MKFVKYLAAFVAAVGLTTACTTDIEQVQLAPAEDAVAPVLDAPAQSEISITLETLKEKLAITWSAADFGAPTQINYAITLATEDGAKSKVLATGVTDKKYEIAYQTINDFILYDYGMGPGLPVNLTLQLAASVGATTVNSNVVGLVATAVQAEKTYTPIYMPGSYQGWAPGDCPAKGQMLYDFAENGVFTGIADFGKANDEAREWKFTTEPNWDFDWGVASGATQDAEAASLQMANNDMGDRSNVTAYKLNRYYHFSMDTKAATLTKNYAFDVMGLVVDGADVEMTFNPVKRRFYVDYEFAADTQIKFRADANDALSWGGAAGKITAGGEAIAVTAGNYRVYLYISNPDDLRYELSGSMYGVEGDGAAAEEEKPEEPEKPVEKQDNLWEVIGNVNGTEWSDAACYMKEISEGVWYSPAFALAGEFKLRFNNDWGVNIGLTEGAELTLATPYVGTADGANIALPEGNYQVALYEETSTIVVFALDGTGWGVVGQVASFDLAWNGDLMAYDIDGKLAVKGLTLTTADVFKFREGQAWSNDRGFGPLTAANVYVDAAAGGANIKVAADGVYDLYLDLANEKIYVMEAGVDPATATYLESTETPEQPAALKLYAHSEEGWTNMNLWAWDADNNYSGGTWPGVAITAHETVNGVDYFVYTFGEEMRGKTISIIFNNGSAQTQDIEGVVLDGPHYYGVKGGVGTEVDPETYAPEGYVPPVGDVWGLIGVNGNWSTDIELAAEGDYFVKKGVEFNAESSFKIRANKTWDNNDDKNYGLEVAGYATINGPTKLIASGGSNDIKVATAGTYDVYFDLANTTVYVMEAGLTPNN